MEKIALLFPGQGSHFVGMGKSLYDQHELARHTFEEAGDILGRNLAKICFEGSLGELSKAENAHTALLTVGVSMFRVYMKELGVAPQFFAGHSLGEYAALTCAGGLRFTDALRIVEYRAKLSEKLANQGGGGMTIVEGVDYNQVETECQKVSTNDFFVTVSAYNAPQQCNISGHQDAVMEVENRILESGGQTTPLIGSAPMHSHLMQEVAIQLKEYLQQFRFGYLRYPVVSNVTARLYQGSESIPDMLLEHMVRPVQWQAIMQYLQRHGVTLAVEMGPQNILYNLTKANTPDIKPLCYGSREGRKTLTDILSAPQFKKHVPTVITKCLAIGVAVPNKNHDNEAYNEGVVKPYRRIQEIQSKLDQEDRSPTIDEMRLALELLKTIMETKQVPIEEQEDWFEQIYDETGTRYLFQVGIPS